MENAERQILRVKRTGTVPKVYIWAQVGSGHRYLSFTSAIRGCFCDRCLQSVGLGYRLLLEAVRRDHEPFKAMKATYGLDSFTGEVTESGQVYREEVKTFLS